MLRRIEGYDTGLVLSALGLVAVSVYVLATAVVGGGHGSFFATYGARQLMYAVLGLALAVAVSRIPLQWFERYWGRLYAVCAGSILLVLVIGVAARGSRRWISLGPLNVQPSEFGKVLVILAVAGFLTQRKLDMTRVRSLIAVLGLTAIPGILVFVQPDLGTSQIFTAIGLGVAFFAGARWLHLSVLFGVAIALMVLVLGLLPAVGVHVLKPYQTQRITGFLHPERDPEGSNYHAIQAKIAIGSGQLTGQPANSASQVGEGFLPEPHTDFVFATLCEQHGFVGGALVLALFALLLSRCLRAVSIAPDRFGQITAGAIATMLGAQVAINVGMTIGLMPVTGVPLPFISYGGSGMLADFAAIGIIASIYRASETVTVRYARRSGASHRLARTRTYVATGSFVDTRRARN